MEQEVKASFEEVNDETMFAYKSANEWIDEAKQRPDPTPLWMNLWYEGEVCCLFADTNVGKSIYAIQIAEEIAKTQPVLYFDFEMSDKQFQMRYTDAETKEVHRFPEGFGRLEFSRNGGVLFDLDSIIEHIEVECVRRNAKVVIIDNVTWICNRNESGDAAGALMQLLISLKKRRNLSILVLAHTPKRYIYAPLTQNSLAGSKRIANFMDSMFAIGLNKMDRPHGRYIKQIKVRSSELLYGETNVIVGQLVKEGCYIHLKHLGTATEKELIEEPDDVQLKMEESRKQIRELLDQKKTVREIADQLGISKSYVSKLAKGA
ncbi:MAG: AAA family ATPase [Muribaculaceae bacterium]|nr:AAA family ATPase [Muribaculaceae bacterium]